MGYTTALALEEELSLEVGLAYHLQGNHYPPVPVAMVQPCIEAIDAFYDEDFDREINLPEGISWRGQTSCPASAIIDAHHLDAWLPECDQYHTITFSNNEIRVENVRPTLYNKTPSERKQK